MTEEKPTYTTYTPPEYLCKELPYPYPNFKKVTVITHRLYGCCPISVEGDEWVCDITWNFDEGKYSWDLPNFFEGEHRTLCKLSLHTLCNYVGAMCSGVSAVDLGIAKSGEDGYVKCGGSGPPRGECAVIYRLHPEPLEKAWLDRYYEFLAKQGHLYVPTMFLEKFAPESIPKRDKEFAEWQKAGSPKFWEKWRNPPFQPRRK